MDNDSALYTDATKRSAPGMLEGASIGLRTDALLTLLLDPDLEVSLTPTALLHANNAAFFNLLPLLIAAVQHVGETPGQRALFVELVTVLRARVAACRGLKLRFLLLLGHPGFSDQWDVRMVHRRSCYQIAWHHIEDLRSSPSNSSDSTLALMHSLSLSRGSSSISAKANKWLEDKKALGQFAMRHLLHPERGIRLRCMSYHLRIIRNAFYGSELVDSIVERGNFADRDDAIKVAERLLESGFITRAGRGKGFSDGKHVYQSKVAMESNDQGYVRVVTSDGETISCWKELQSCKAETVKKIQVQIALDMVDLQSLEFWKDSVYIKGAEKGYRFGYRAILHPLFCAGIEMRDSFEVVTPSLEEAEAFADIESQDSSSLEPSRGSLMNGINDMGADSSIIGSVVVRKVFSSIARPMIIEMRIPSENADLEDDGQHIVLNPNLIVKEGDNLMQDLAVEVMSQCFNHIWRNSAAFFPDASKAPYSFSYEVFPTSLTAGFMEAVTGLTSLREYDWKNWRMEYGGKPEAVETMLRSAAGSYIATYICGGRDRHFDNILLKTDGSQVQLLHIDFGFVMGSVAPIDGARIAIAADMERAFKALNVWEQFVEMCGDAFMAVRAEAPSVIRAAVLLFSKAGFEPDKIRDFLASHFSLNTHESSKEAARAVVTHQVVTSSNDQRTKFKAFSHQHIDPAWYGLIEKGFPPAVAIMRMIELKAAKKLSGISSSRRPAVSIEETVLLKEL